MPQSGRTQECVAIQMVVGRGEIDLAPDSPVLAREWADAFDHGLKELNVLGRSF